MGSPIKKAVDLFRRTPIGVSVRFILFVFAKKLFNPPAIASYSQFGEDRFLDAYFMDLSNGFYVDVGSNRPRHYSNTWKLYLRGWRGIVVDGNEALIAEHRRVRPKDIAVSAVIAASSRIVQFQIPDQTHLTASIFSESEECDRGKARVIDIQAMQLQELLQRHSVSRKFEFLSVDVEGGDLDVLRSLDLRKFQPRLIAVEAHDFQFEKALIHPIFKLLTKHDYRLVAWHPPTVFFEKVSAGG